MNEMNSTVNITNTGNMYDQNSGYCFYRLPCGLCQKTNTQCPKAYMAQGWTVTTATNTVNGEREHEEAKH